MNTWLLLWFVLGTNNNGYPPTVSANHATFSSEAACQAAIAALSKAVSVGQRVQIDAACVKS